MESGVTDLLAGQDSAEEVEHEVRERARRADPEPRL